MNDKPTPSVPDKRPYKIGIALSGGGARGFAHAGALKALEESGIKPDIVAGVSAGSVVAVMYAAGMSPEKILDVFCNTSFHNFVKFSLGQGAIFDIRKFRDFILDKIKPYTLLEDLPVKTVIGVTDFDNACPAEFHTGPIGDRVLASCSIPIVFKPVTINGVQYVDGGVLRNLPAWAIRDKCDFLVGVNVSPVHKSKHFSSIVDIAMHTFNLMAKSNQAVDMGLCDLAIATPELSHYKVFNLKEIKKVYNAGYLNMRKALRDAGLWQRGDSAPSVKKTKTDTEDKKI